MGFGQLVRGIAIVGMVSSGSVAIARPVLALGFSAEDEDTNLMDLEADATDVALAQPAIDSTPALQSAAALVQPAVSFSDSPTFSYSTSSLSSPPLPASPVSKNKDSLSQNSRPDTAELGMVEIGIIDLKSKNLASHELTSRTGQLPPLLISQNAPASEQLTEPENDLTPLPEQTPVLPEAEVLPPAEQPTPSTSSDQVMVSEIQVMGSSVFSKQDFADIVEPFEGRSLGLRELRQVADNITQLYLESGYITSRAVLGEQTITDGVVTVRVIEGELDEIQVEGTSRLTGYVRDRINLANRKPLNQISLESQLQLLRADPLFERVEASLRAGEGEGQSDLVVRVLEAPTLSGRAVLDTNSPPSVGIARMGIETDFNNLLGLGDRLGLSAYRSTAGGSNSYGVNYTVPLNAMNGTLQARYLPSSFNLISESLATLDVSGSSSTYEATYRQPFIRKPNEEFALSLGFRHRTGETLVSDVVIDSTRTSVVQFGQDYLKRDRTGAWGLRSQFNFGTGLLDATNREDNEADGQFFSWLGQIQRAQVINRDNLLIAQSSLQLSADSLLGADQFIIGGANSVRGYDQNARFGDNGLRASIENRTTVLRNENGSAAVQIAPFLDAAGVWNTGDNTSEQRFLVGTGVGFVTNLVENVQARLDVGIPLVELSESGDSNQDIFLYFNMDYRF